MQVLHEFYVTTTQKLRPGMVREDARRDVGDLARWAPVGLDSEMIESAWEAQDRFEVSFFDALILAAAGRTGCGHLLSEDFQDGRDYGYVTVLDPFRHAPEELGL